MKTATTRPSCETWRWLHELEKATPSFWILFSQLGQCPFEYGNQATIYHGSVDLENAFLSEEGCFLTTQPSLNIKTSHVDRIFVEEAESNPQGRVELDFKDRKSSLSFYRCPPKALKLMTTLFGWEIKPETPALSSSRELTPLTVCRCCAGAAEARRNSVATNPLLSILTSLTEAGQQLTLNLCAPSLNLVTQLQPLEVRSQRGNIIVRSADSELIIDTGHLHGLLIRDSQLDNEDVCELSLVNSHGEIFTTISAPATIFQDTWKSSLSSSNGSYQAIV